MDISRGLSAAAKIQRQKTKEVWHVFFSQEKVSWCVSLLLLLILHLGWREQWAGETKIRLFISTHPHQWASLCWWPHSCSRQAPRNPCPPAYRCGFNVSPHPCGCDGEGAWLFSVCLWPRRRLAPKRSPDDELLYIISVCEDSFLVFNDLSRI